MMPIDINCAALLGAGSNDMIPLTVTEEVDADTGIQLFLESIEITPDWHRMLKTVLWSNSDIF
jgi:hypothetical protein